MNHRPITEDDLHAYVDRVLEPELQAEVAGYLGDHPDVAKRVDAFSDRRDQLRAAHAPIAAEPLPAELNLSRIIENRARRPSLARWAMAARLLLSIGGLGGWAVRGALQASPGGLVALAQEAAVSYSVYAPDRVRPVEVRASGSAQLVKWVSRRLRRSFKVSARSTSGYRLVGVPPAPTPHPPAAFSIPTPDPAPHPSSLTR